MFSLRTLLVCSALLMPTILWAHGEENPGPHGGHIQMPGAFHTELTLDSKQEAHIYLLDINFQNPTVKDSSVSVIFKDKSQQIPFQCAVMEGNHFHCIPEKKLPKKGQLVVKAVREKAPGNEAVYKLPLKAFEHAKPHEQKEESGHHH